MDKAAQIREALAQLSVRDSLTLARAVELGRAVGKEELPTELMLTAMRPTLQKANAPRVPTLCRLVCNAFEDFLTNRIDDPRPPGQIARAAIQPWWRGLQRLDRGDLKRLSEQLSQLWATRGAEALGEVVGEAQAAAVGWTRTLHAELTKPRPDASLRQLFPNRQLIDDLQDIARILALAGPLGQAWKAIDQELEAAGKLAGRVILDLTPSALTVAKQHYMALSDAHGVEARYLPLGLLNRLAEPCQILRLGRALSWKQNDTLMRDTDFGTVGERLILDLQRLARDIKAAFGGRQGLPDLVPLTVALTRYMEGAEGLLGEMGFRRDSPWGERILETRVTLGEALDPDCLMSIAEEVILAEILPMQEPERPDRRSRNVTPEPDLTITPTPDKVEAAVGAARFLMLLAQRGSRHGFGQGVRPAIDAVDEAIEQRATALLDVLRRKPADPAIAAQLRAAITILEILFEDGRAGLLARRIRIASQASA